MLRFLHRIQRFLQGGRLRQFLDGSDLGGLLRGRLRRGGFLNHDSFDHRRLGGRFLGGRCGRDRRNDGADLRRGRLRRGRLRNHRCGLRSRWLNRHRSRLRGRWLRGRRSSRARLRRAAAILLKVVVLDEHLCVQGLRGSRGLAAVVAHLHQRTVARVGKAHGVADLVGEGHGDARFVSSTDRVGVNQHPHVVHVAGDATYGAAEVSLLDGDDFVAGFVHVLETHEFIGGLDPFGGGAVDVLLQVIRCVKVQGVFDEGVFVVAKHEAVHVRDRRAPLRSCSGFLALTAEWVDVDVSMGGCRSYDTACDHSGCTGGGDQMSIIHELREHHSQP